MSVRDPRPERLTVQERDVVLMRVVDECFRGPGCGDEHKIVVGPAVVPLAADLGELLGTPRAGLAVVVFDLDEQERLADVVLPDGAHVRVGEAGEGALGQGLGRVPVGPEEFGDEVLDPLPSRGEERAALPDGVEQTAREVDLNAALLGCGVVGWALAGKEAVELDGEVAEVADGCAADPEAPPEAFGKVGARDREQRPVRGAEVLSRALVCEV